MNKEDFKKLGKEVDNMFKRQTLQAQEFKLSANIHKLENLLWSEQEFLQSLEDRLADFEVDPDEYEYEYDKWLDSTADPISYTSSCVGKLSEAFKKVERGLYEQKLKEYAIEQFNWSKTSSKSYVQLLEDIADAQKEIQDLQSALDDDRASYRNLLDKIMELNK